MRKNVLIIKQQMNPEVDQYFIDGCGRCERGGTSECNVHKYPEALSLLRSIALESGLEEQRKWGNPCYTLNNKNIFIIAAFNNYCSIGFLKGALLKDPQNILEKPGENSNSVRQIRFTNSNKVIELSATIKEYIYEAIEIEKAGKQIKTTKISAHDYPEVLISVFNEEPEFKKAFEALTPGRQRSYLIHFNQAKQSKTRLNRINKNKAKIFTGKGMNEY